MNNTYLNNITRTALLTAALFFSLQSAQAQMPSNDEAMNSVSNEGSDQQISKQTRITARFVEGIVYLNWYMKGETENSVFIVERSANGSEYTTIGFKDGFSAPDSNLELLYSFKDTEPQSGSCSYRIRQFKNSGVLFGKEVFINIEKPADLVIKE